LEAVFLLFATIFFATGLCGFGDILSIRFKISSRSAALGLGFSVN
jgi:hypothetical protein